MWVVERSTFSSDWPRNQRIYKVRKVGVLDVFEKLLVVAKTTE